MTDGCAGYFLRSVGKAQIIRDWGGSTVNRVATYHVASKALALAGLKRLALPLILVGGRIEVTRHTVAKTFPLVTAERHDSLGF